ncbi:hypothetical protein FF1_019483 [Malus domestica]
MILVRTTFVSLRCSFALFVQSLKIDHNPPADKVYEDALKFLEEKVKHMNDYIDDDNNDINTLTTLEFIDDSNGWV